MTEYTHIPRRPCFTLTCEQKKQDDDLDDHDDHDDQDDHDDHTDHDDHDDSDGNDDNNDNNDNHDNDDNDDNDRYGDCNSYVMLRERSYLAVIKSKEVNIAKEVKWVIQDGHGLSLREALPNQNVYFF